MAENSRKHMRTRGDRIGPRYELAETERLEQEAELILDPVMMHTRVPHRGRDMPAERGHVPGSSHSEMICHRRPR